MQQSLSLPHLPAGKDVKYEPSAFIFVFSCLFFATRFALLDGTVEIFFVGSVYLPCACAVPMIVALSRTGCYRWPEILVSKPS